MANKRITQLPTAPQVEDNDYLAIDNTSTPTAENTGGTRKILVKDITAKSADAVEYDNTSSGLEADNVQDAIDEVLEEGGKVQDVKVNGVSVLDNNKTAQIVSYKEVTQAQYDALPSSKLTDGIMYCIKDAEFSAEDVPYDNSDSGLASEDVQSAVDEIADVLGALKVEGTVENQSIATFTDGSALPMPKLEIAVEPQQDLHGYDAPWVGGSGKNKCPINESTITGATYIVDTDINIASGTWTFSFESAVTTNCSLQITDADGNTLASVGISNPSRSATVTINAVGKHLKFYGYAGTYKKIQIESGTTATTFAPYSNICPIIGWNAVDVTKCGANQWDEEWEVGGISTMNGQNISLSAIRSNGYSPCKPSTAYYTRFTNDGYVFWYDADKNYISNSYSEASMRVVQSPSNANYFRIRKDGITTYNNDISINYPSTDTEYHPYNPNSETITIQLGSTYYGGKLDVVSGVLTVDREYVDLGDLSYTYEDTATPKVFRASLSPTPKLSGYTVCSVYKGTSKGVGALDNGELCISGTQAYPFLRIRDDAYTDATAFKTSVNGQQLVYELATPIEIQLTPTQVNSLMGVNNIWANTGKINKAVYIRDLNIVINNLLNA